MPLEEDHSVVLSQKPNSNRFATQNLLHFILRLTVRPKRTEIHRKFLEILNFPMVPVWATTKVLLVFRRPDEIGIDRVNQSTLLTSLLLYRYGYDVVLTAKNLVNNFLHKAEIFVRDLDKHGPRLR